MLYINLYVELPAIPTYTGKSILTLDNITLSKEHKAVACAMTATKKWVDFSIFTNGTIQVSTVGDAIDSGDRVVISFVIPI